MQVSCASCGVAFDSLRSNARFCSDRCRKRGQRGHLTAVQVAGAPKPADGVLAATQAELEAVERAGSSLGRAALALAGRIDAGQDTGSGLAAVTREWRATLEAATAGATAAANPVDQLQARRQQRLG